MIAVKVTLTASATGISISVDKEPIQLGGDPDIEWTLDDASYAAGWTFASRGIDIKAPSTAFKNKKGSANGKKHGWKSVNSDGNKYKYTINLENLDSGTQLTWDPFIVNN